MQRPAMPARKTLPAKENLALFSFPAFPPATRNSKAAVEQILVIASG
jgi:hypothetical protein